MTFLVLMAGLRASAQVDRFLPEVDVYYKPGTNVRLYFQAKETREGGDSTQAEIGPSIQFYLKPWWRLASVAPDDMDDSKLRSVVAEAGFRVLPSPSEATVQRIEPVLTINFPVVTAFLLSNRNRMDLDWQSGQFYWRYRNMTQFAKRLTIGHYHPSPYANVEFFYESRYGKWSDTAIEGGMIFPLRRHMEFDGYYCHQNNTGKSPNQPLNQVGLKVKLLF